MRTAPRCKRHRGLSWTPKKHQSGEIDYTGRISKIGDGSRARRSTNSAHIILTKPLKGCSQITTEEMGDSDPQTHRHVQGQLWARLPIGGDHASHTY